MEANAVLIFIKLLILIIQDFGYLNYRYCSNYNYWILLICNILLYPAIY